MTDQVNKYAESRKKARREYEKRQAENPEGRKARTFRITDSELKQVKEFIESIRRAEP